MQLPRLLVAGSESGVGKTLLTAGLIKAFCRRGYTVQPFKVGPDYIDPGYHSHAAGRIARNLDVFLLGEAGTREVFHRAASGADLAIIEGVMGLFDGRKGSSDEASSAHVARLLDAPVVLILNARGAGRSLAATAYGFKHFDPGLHLAAVIPNHVGSAHHGHLVSSVLEREVGVTVAGALPRKEGLEIPERHLGLLPAQEKAHLEPYLEELADHLERHLDLEALLDIARSAGPLETPGPAAFPALPRPQSARVAVAHDEAFSFYYQDNLDLLTAWGAHLTFFSPLRHRALPPQCGAVYLGGGFPELYAAQLASNHALKQDLQRAAGDNMPIYAECGGFMYLGQELVDGQGQCHSLAGVLPVRTRMHARLSALGYVKARPRENSWLFQENETLRAHEFHYSSFESREDGFSPLFQVKGSRDSGFHRHEGLALNRVLASYLHLHLAGHPHLARRLVEAAAAYT